MSWGPRISGAGTAKGGFDCSGLIRYAFAKHGVDLPRTSAEQAREGVMVDKDFERMRPGDILTFSKPERSGHHPRRPLHRRPRFIHSCITGVQISVLDPGRHSGRWWYRRWIGVRRVVAWIGRVVISWGQGGSPRSSRRHDPRTHNRDLRGDRRRGGDRVRPVSGRVVFIPIALALVLAALLGRWSVGSSGLEFRRQVGATLLLLGTVALVGRSWTRALWAGPGLGSQDARGNCGRREEGPGLPPRFDRLSALVTSPEAASSSRRFDSWRRPIR
jgi:hypothetical protein